MKKISVIGLWHLGLVNCVGFCEKGYQVSAIDFNKPLINNLKKGIPPLFEPNLEEKIAKYLKNKKLSFFDSAKSVKNSDYVIIAYDSPVNDKDEVDISPVVKAS